MFNKLKLSQMRKIILCVFFLSFSFVIFAGAPTDLAIRFLSKANDAIMENNIDTAYKNINTALVISYDSVDENDKLHQDVISFAQSIYERKIKQLMINYDELELVDLKMNLEKFPLVKSPSIEKLIKKIDSDDYVIESDDKLNEYEDRLNELEAESELLASSQNEFSKAFGAVIEKNTEVTKRSTNIIAFAVISISAIILLVIVLIFIIFKKGFSQQHLQQEQYIQAFKMMASNQNGNHNILGGVTDIYGNNSPLKIAGSSVWRGKKYNEISFDKDDEKELKNLAIKCEELGSKIDSVTGRKNNSKNVSEIVYKLSLQLGLSTEMAMLNFCAAMVYDAGFLGIDPDLLSSSILTKEEKESLKIHVSLAEDYLNFVPKKYWTIFEDAVMKHHENIDGSGYPKGLKGDEIPLIARLIHIAESYISISSRRSYRAPIDKETAVAKLKAEPALYDEDIVEALDKIV